MNRRSLTTSVTCSGVGIHTGAPSSVRLKPAAWGTGVLFLVDGQTVPATIGHAEAVVGAMVLNAKGRQVQTPEHLLAALRGLGITDVQLELCGPEVPMLDGGATAWVDAIDAAGRCEGPAWASIPVTSGSMHAFGGSVQVSPGPFRVSVCVDFPGLRGEAHWDGDEARFRSDVAWARTFVMAADVDALKAAGRGRGASRENTVVVDSDTDSREPVAHKLLDAIGDLSLIPGLSGHWRIDKGSHRLHQQAMKELISR